ncbi:MAG: acyltransferase family protein [Candidatus Bathyarchaeota archaeon]|nr:acyltransferase family protein [Candidatus Termiticorpusculum sp.]
MDNVKSTSVYVSVNLICVVALFSVILLHSAFFVTNDVLIHDSLAVYRGWIVTLYMCIGRIGVPLFIMLIGALTFTQVKKDETLKTFFKKRFSRVCLPFLFWGLIYFLWAVCVEKQVVTQEFIVKNIFSGSYVTFSEFYLFMGLYLALPLLRVMVANFTNKHFKYFIILWFVGTTLAAWIKFVSGWQYQIDANLFIIPQSIGYFVVGAYISKVQVKRRISVSLTFLGIILSVIGTYLLVWNAGDVLFFFQEYSSITVFLASVSLFMLLNSYGNFFEVSQMVKLSWKHRVLQVISENSLSIYLFHIIVFYLIINGFFGLVLNGYAIDAIIGVPLIAILALLLSLVILIPIKKLRGLDRLIG